MELQTKYFGGIRCEDKDVLHFSEGVFGFEEEKQFLLMPFEGGDGMLLCLQSVATSQLAFVAVDPFRLNRNYAPVLQPQELRQMGVVDSTELCYYTFCVVKNPIGNSTVNLKCPIAINDVSRQARQVMLEQYEMRCLLSDLVGKEGGSC